MISFFFFTEYRGLGAGRIEFSVDWLYFVYCNVITLDVYTYVYCNINSSSDFYEEVDHSKHLFLKTAAALT